MSGAATIAAIAAVATVAVSAYSVDQQSKANADAKKQQQKAIEQQQAAQEAQQRQAAEAMALEQQRAAEAMRAQEAQAAAQLAMAERNITQQEVQLKTAEQSANKANAKRPDASAMMAAAEQSAKAGASGTMLTGPQGIDPNALSLSKNTLLGG